jgi:large subunit ribosomal protein L1
MMARRGKRYRELATQPDKARLLSPSEAVEAVKKLANAHFDETVDIAIRLNVDARKGEQMVRGIVTLPHGSGKVPRVAAVARGEKATEAQEAGADVVGAEDLVQRIDQGWKDFDVLVATRDVMSLVGRLGKKLGPRMPNPKAGTVSDDIARVIRELKSGRLEFRMDKGAVVHAPIGKVSLLPEHLLENMAVLVGAVARARPPAVRGQFITHIALSPTMGPSVRVDPGQATELAER